MFLLAYNLIEHLIMIWFAEGTTNVVITIAKPENKFNKSTQAMRLTMRLPSSTSTHATTPSSLLPNLCHRLPPGGNKLSASNQMSRAQDSSTERSLAHLVVLIPVPHRWVQNCFRQQHWRIWTRAPTRTWLHLCHQQANFLDWMHQHTLV